MAPGAVAAYAAIDLPGDVAGVILAGGQGRRMGGRDKGWIAWQGRPLVECVLERLRPQVARVGISANRNLARYEALGCESFADDPDLDPRTPGQGIGPLAGMLAALERGTQAWLACVPCDAPLLPLDLVARLAAVPDRDARPRVACTQGRLQPVFCLLPRTLAPALRAAIEAGARRPQDFLRDAAAIEVEFADARAFANVNAPQDLAPAP